MPLGRPGTPRGPRGVGGPGPQPGLTQKADFLVPFTPHLSWLRKSPCRVLDATTYLGPIVFTPSRVKVLQKLLLFHEPFFPSETT